MYYLYALYNTNWVDVLPKCNNLSWASSEDTLAVELSFDSIYNLPEGTHLILSNDGKIIFRGLIIKKIGKQKTASYTAMDYAFYLNKNETIIQFNGVQAGEAIRQVCNKFGILNNVCNIVTVINKLYKGQSCADIIKDILEQSTNDLGVKFIMEMRERTLYISQLNDLKVTATIKINSDFTLDTSIEEMKNAVIVVSNAENDTRILESVEDDVNQSKYGTMTKVLTVDDKNESQARNIAKNYLSENNKTFRDIGFTALDIKGGDDIKANRMIYIQISKYSIDGWFKIKSAQHTLNNNNHKIAIQIDW